MKIGKRNFEDAWEFSEYAQELINDYIKEIWETKEWGKHELTEDEYWEDNNGGLHTEVTSKKLDNFLHRAELRLFKIGSHYFGEDNLDLEIKCTWLVED